MSQEHDTGDFPRTERGEVARRHLAVHTWKPPALDLPDERDQRHFRCVRYPAEHRLAEEHPPESDAV